MFIIFLHVLLHTIWITTPVIAINQLFSYIDGSVGDVLGSAFGLPGTNATFDYIVIGGGTAGLTIATRLA